MRRTTACLLFAKTSTTDLSTNTRSFSRSPSLRYVDGARIDQPPISPVFGDLSNLPPTLIQVSRDELVFGDAVRYSNKAAAAGSPIELQVWPKLVHVFQLFGPDLLEATDALELAAEFIRAQVKSERR